MPLISICVVIVGLFWTSAAFFSFTAYLDVFHLHHTPQSMWTVSDSTALNRDKSFPPCNISLLWKRNKFGAASTIDNSSDRGYANIYVCWEENEGDCLGTCQLMIRGDGSLEDEQLDGFSNVVTSSGGVIIGGSCTGGLFLFCLLIYFLYRLFKDDPTVHPAARHDPPGREVTNQNRAFCPHCRNVPSSPPPAYNEVLAMGQCAELCACMSAPPANSKPSAI